MIKKLFNILIALFFLSSLFATPEKPDTWLKAYYTSVTIYYEYSFKDIYGTNHDRVAQGSGVIVGTNQILSVFHLGDKRPPGYFTAVIIYQTETRQVELRLVRWDRHNDLCLFEFDKPFDRDYIKIAESWTLGEPIMFGNHNALRLAKLRYGTLTWRQPYGIMVYPIYLGDSGSGVFNMKAELLGIINILLVVIHKGIITETLVGYATDLDKIRVFLELPKVTPRKKMTEDVSGVSKEFKKEFKMWIYSEVVQEFFKEHKKKYPKAYEELLKFLKEQIK